MRWILLVALAAGCASPPVATVRHGDEIVVCGQYFRIGAPVVLWSDPGGYDAYRVERGGQTEYRYDMRREGLSEAERERVGNRGWDLPLLQRVVDQFVLHYDVCGTSRQCFKVLHDMRVLSVHFMLDIDGTIYQTLDLKERAWHATIANHRSIGVEIANIGAYGENEKDPLATWYRKEDGRTRITLPASMGDGGVRTKGFVGRPARDEIVVGEVQGRKLRQHDFTPEQYESLICLTAALCSIFPKIACDYPRETRKLDDAALKAFGGVLGHYHVQLNKVDPGPAFDWERVIQGARQRISRRP